MRSMRDPEIARLVQRSLTGGFLMLPLLLWRDSARNAVDECVGQWTHVSR